MDTLPKKILVCDFHIGLNMAQSALINNLKAECDMLSLSHHAIKYLPQTSTHIQWNKDHFFKTTNNLFNRRHKRFVTSLLNALNFRIPLSWDVNTWSRLKTKRLIRELGEEFIEKHFLPYDAFVVSFPPVFAHFFFVLAEKYDKQLILNLGHRFNIRISSAVENQHMLVMMKFIHEHPVHILASGFEYDLHYTEYYLNIKPIKLPVICSHLSLEVPQPELETILVGPAHFRNQNIERELNQFSIKWHQRKGEKTLEFALIKNIYPHYRYDDLTRHPAIVLFPYSAYSISMMELYELNIPFFVPSPEFIIKHKLMNDRVLYPIYCSEKEYSAFDMPTVSDIPYSPNSYAYDDQMYWLPFSFFYQVKNAIVWDSFEDLFEKISSADFGNISQQMLEENKSRRKDALDKWERVLL